MDNATEQTFQSWPERLFVLSATGQITYQGGKGPYDFNIEELEQFLSATLSTSCIYSNAAEEHNPLSFPNP